ncbi:MAG: FAD-binding oxidoreductase [Anaerolineales bacterium]|nr:FAD-binding oxidoreductase [Anaerolineales bacterium]
MNDIVFQLIRAFGTQKVLTGAALESRRSSYLENAPLTAKALLLPTSTEDVSAMLHMCQTASQVVVPQGGLTNLVFNTHTTSDEIALSLEGLNQIEEIDPLGGTLTVQAGATLQRVQDAASAAGLFFPLDLPARESAVIGGLVGTNAGGLRVVRYGMMRDIVLGLEVVLADGTVLNMMNKMLKKNAGYDLKQLFIGAEGTLGVVTRAVLRLEPPQPAASTAFLAVERFEQVAALLVLAKECLGGQLTSFEVLWNEFYRLTTTPPAPNPPSLPQDSPCYVLVECLGKDEEEEKARMQVLLNQARRQNLFTAAMLAQTPEQRSAFWRAREDTTQMEQQYRVTYHFDVSLPIVHMESYLARVQSELNAVFGNVKLWIFGHLADSNLHIGVGGGSVSEEGHKRVEEIIYLPLMPIAGSISAEHGIGLRKKPYLGLSRTTEEVALMRRLKSVLDPRGILNPGKIFDLDSAS